jgi:hypothetical protein
MTAVPREIVDVIADEMACGVDRAVECWMSQVEQALNAPRLTSLGRGCTLLRKSWSGIRV